MIGYRPGESKRRLYSTVLDLWDKDWLDLCGQHGIRVRLDEQSLGRAHTFHSR